LRISPSELTSSDALSGRGKQIYNHEGNVRYRKLLQQYESQYKDKSNKLGEKQFCVAKIVAIVRFLKPSGRFLKKHEETGFREEIGDVKAREKTREALTQDRPKASSRAEMIPLTQHDDDSINIHNINLELLPTRLQYFSSISTMDTIDMGSICSCYDRIPDPPKFSQRDNTGISQEFIGLDDSSDFLACDEKIMTSIKFEEMIYARENARYSDSLSDDLDFDILFSEMDEDTFDSFARISSL